MAKDLLKKKKKREVQSKKSEIKLSGTTADEKKEVVKNNSIADEKMHHGHSQKTRNGENPLKKKHFPREIHSGTMSVKNVSRILQKLDSSMENQDGGWRHIVSNSDRFIVFVMVLEHKTSPKQIRMILFFISLTLVSL